MNKYNIDQVHSTIGFSVKHLIVSKVKGFFGKFEGSLSTDDENFTNAKINFSADVASINTNNAMRDGHLHTDDFFNAAEFPQITFVSNSFVKKDDSNFTVVGDFTMKGITKEITLNAAFQGFIPGEAGKKIAAFEVIGVINRLDYGVSWNSPLENGGVAVSNDVMLDAVLQLKQE